MSRGLPYWENLSPATVIAEAKRWVGDWEFIEIESIGWKPENGASGLWHPPWKEQTKARITFGWDMTAEMLWHEVFHSVAGNAPLIKLEPMWGEGWCCAFADANRDVWTPLDGGEPGPDTLHRLYGYAAAVLGSRVGSSASKLRDLWLGWNLLARSGASLNAKSFSKFIGYDPERGKYC